MSKQQKDTDTLGTGNGSDDDDEDDFQIRPRIDILKDRARQLGIVHSPNIGADTLAKKIEDYLNDTQGLFDEADQDEGVKEIVKLTLEETKSLARKRAQKLVRVNITPNDPLRAQLNGEMVFVGNALTGTIGKFVPFGTTRGYMIPEAILNVLKERTYTFFKFKKDQYNNDIPYPVQRKAFNIEYLEPLTQKQINAIAERQRAAAKWDEEADDEAVTEI